MDYARIPLESSFDYGTHLECANVIRALRQGDLIARGVASGLWGWRQVWYV
ncbi:MAG: hypothetical protein K8R88_01285 [Armatimonadetes bacterium]|nr:hypothetical protein [Armatimonadota bacterium]